MCIFFLYLNAMVIKVSCVCFSLEKCYSIIVWTFSIVFVSQTVIHTVKLFLLGEKNNSQIVLILLGPFFLSFGFLERTTIEWKKTIKIKKVLMRATDDLWLGPRIQELATEERLQSKENGGGKEERCWAQHNSDNRGVWVINDPGAGSLLAGTMHTPVTDVSQMDQKGWMWVTPENLKTW